MNIMSEFKEPFIPPRHGGTVRQKGVRNHKVSEVTYSRSGVDLSERTAVYPTTVLDDHPMATRFMFARSSYLGPVRSATILLDNSGAWEWLITLLEENCISKKRVRGYRSMFKDDYMVTYTLPAIGEIVVTEDKRTRKLNKYARRLDRIIPFGSLRLRVDRLYYRPNARSFEQVKSFAYSVPKDTRRVYGSIRMFGGCCNVNMNAGAIGSNYNRHIEDGTVNYFIVDLGSNVNITHISSMGKLTSIMRFPSYDETREYSIPDKHRDRITYYDDNEKHWVINYRVEVRVNSGREWIRVGNFGGNASRSTEIVNTLDIGFPVRYVKVVPMGHVGSTSMQIGLFEKGFDKKVDIAKTVDYTLTVPSKRRFYNCRQSRRSEWQLEGKRILSKKKIRDRDWETRRQVAAYNTKKDLWL